MRRLIILALTLACVAPIARAQDTTYRTVQLHPAGPMRWRTLYDVFQGTVKLGTVGQDSSRHWIAMRAVAGSPFITDLSPTYTTLRLAARRLLVEQYGTLPRDSVVVRIVYRDTVIYRRKIIGDTIYLKAGDPPLVLMHGDTLTIPVRVRP